MCATQDQHLPCDTTVLVTDQGSVIAGSEVIYGLPDLSIPPDCTSERPRLRSAYSCSLTEARLSDGSSGTSISQPSTPGDPMHHRNGYCAQTWCDGFGVPFSTTFAMSNDSDNNAGFRDRHNSTHTRSESLASSSYASEMTYSSPGSYDLEALRFPKPFDMSRDEWMGTDHEASPSHLCRDEKALRCAHNANAYGQPRRISAAAPCFANTLAMVHPSQTMTLQRYPSSTAASDYQLPQSAIPSRLIPDHGHVISPYTIGGLQGLRREPLLGFSSSGAGYEKWDPNVHYSSNMPYFSDQSEEEEGVRSYDTSYPAMQAPVLAQPDHVLRSHTDSTQRSSRKSPKRQRKSHVLGRAFAEYQWNDQLHVRLEGRPFVVERDENGRLNGIITEEALRDTKPHKCTYRDSSDKLCGRSFERSEHLKRHMGMHSNERPYPCPLPGCDKRIGRPDNAGDHFKTHLRPPSKGKRNKHCDWKTLRECILREYAERPASKLLSNLQKWLAIESRKMEQGRQGGR